MILETMLQRLFASLARGPGLNARPHHSRQRLDVCELAALGGTDPASMLRVLLGPPPAAVEFPASTPFFRRPEEPSSEWTDEQRSADSASERQSRILTKLRDIVTDATDYRNDYGENALFLGFPLLSLPPGDERDEFRSNRLLAPLLLAPLQLSVRHGPRSGITLEPAGDGAEFLIPNPALLAWIEQQTGEDTDVVFADDQAEDPWREVAEVLALVGRAAGLTMDVIRAFGPGALLQPVPRIEQLPDAPALLPCAVLGLFPLTNPGLVRDTKWMMEHDERLHAPVRGFLTTKALTASSVSSTASDTASDDAAASSEAARTFLVANADPCQAAAVAHARVSEALVIHGPPGTGKSQTIANIIGDHLARGQRVLFVCDKRTALDVVKFRLDGMGLGALCGVIHDPQHDRRPLYLELRERLDTLVDAPAPRDPSAELAHVAAALEALHAELRAAFDSLQAAAPGARSFHDLCGEWLALQAQHAAPMPEIEGLTRELLDRHRTDADELLRRAARCGWTKNPFRGRLGLSLGAWLATSEAAVRGKLEEIRRRSEALDLTINPYLPELDAETPLPAQAAARRALADAVEKLVQHRGGESFVAAATRNPDWPGLASHHASIAAAGALLDTPPDRELALATQARIPVLGEINTALRALEEWAAVQDSWKRIFARGRRKQAEALLAPHALALNPAGVARLQAFLQGLRARWLWSDLVSRVRTREAPLALTPDAELRAVRDVLPALLAFGAALEAFTPTAQRARILETFWDPAELVPQLLAALRESAERADALAALEQAWRDSGLFTAEAIKEQAATWRAAKRALPLAQALLGAVGSLDDLVRLEDRRQTLPAPLDAALAAAAAAGLLWDAAEPALRAAAIARELRARLRDDPALARVDTQRVEAAFAELQERTARRHELTRAHVLFIWQTRWRQRLLASTGTRLNPLAASMRQRLFVRGQRALKLRQMIAAGAATEGGDPLFDLCPVWMASPATVAQIFPREPLFDVVVFDEASQCRLEEALPVLLRGRRVVIAGDPKQLPPTRFFEQGLAESETADAETVEEVFQQQQSETEDLLGAALNLDVQEAFLDVHYRSKHEALIGFSNAAFYGGRLQPVPAHPRRKAREVPIRLLRVDGVYEKRGNPAEARAAVDLVAELLSQPRPPSIGIACFNLPQRELILDVLDERAEADAEFAKRLESARQRRGRDSFEGLFVKNLENVQGDERDHMIICTTFGPAPDGRFRRNFGALSQVGGERRLNVLVTRAREAIHVITSIPRSEYTGGAGAEAGAGGALNGRLQLYRYLRYAEMLQPAAAVPVPATPAVGPSLEIVESASPSKVAEALGELLQAGAPVGATVHWGNEGFCVDVALAHPTRPGDVTLGLLTDFNRFRKTPDPVAWELFRAQVLRGQGWELHRLWTPALFRDAPAQLAVVRAKHAALAEQKT